MIKWSVMFWNDPSIMGSNIEKWQTRFRLLRPKLKGWNRNRNAWYRELKKDILSKLDVIDKNCELYGLSAEDRNEQLEIRAQLDRLLKQEEAKWKQRAKVDELLEGDGNTKFFHAKANGRHRRNKIHSLDQEEGKIEGDKNLMEYITRFYKELFGPPDNSSVSLEVEHAKKISQEHRDKLIDKFSLEEIKHVVFNMAHNKSPGPDGFTVEFYQHFWDLIKNDLKLF